MPGFYAHEEMDALEDEDILESLNEEYGRFIIDINYNRPLKNFPMTLNKIDEVDETSIKSPSGGNQDENGNQVIETRKNIAWSIQNETGNRRNKEKERPKSANNVNEVSNNETLVKRPKSSCAGYPTSKIPIKTKKEAKKYRSDSDCSSGLSIEDEDSQCYRDREIRKRNNGRDNDPEKLISFHESYPLRPKSACAMRKDELYKSYGTETKRCNSQPNITRCQSPADVWATWYRSDVTRFRRSLKLLGLSNSDFGLPDSPKKNAGPPRPRSSAGGTPTFTTRVLQRSISLDSLKEVVRESVGSPCPGLPHRRLLAQAAYEEWYFKKGEEINKKLEEERVRNEKIKESIDIENMMRRAKASEQYLKWVEKKKNNSNSKVLKTSIKINSKLESRLIKSRDEIDKAYLDWKRKKQQEFSARKKLLDEVAKSEDEKARKTEKQIQADKVFKEWKAKLEKSEKVKRAKDNQAKEKIKEQLTARTKSNTTFQAWKEQKEGEIKVKSKKQRDAAQRAHDELSMTMTERQYEAEQAFDQWLDKVDNRRLANTKTNFQAKQKVPWAPT